MTIILPDHDLEMDLLQEEDQEIVTDLNRKTDQLNQEEEDQESHRDQEIAYQGIESHRDRGIVHQEIVTHQGREIVNHVVEMHLDHVTENSRLGGEKTDHIPEMMIEDLEATHHALEMEA